MSDYSLVRLSPDNFPDLLKLMEVVNEASPDERRLREKYDTHKFGAQYVGYLAYKNGDKSAAAYYGVFPMKFLLANGSQILAAQSGDTMTHPDHRGKGLFIELARKTYALAKEEGIKFVFGFPNANSYPGFVKKLAWQHPYDMSAVNIFAPTIPLNLIAKRVPILAKLQQKWLSFLLQLFFTRTQETPLPCSSVTGTGFSGILRDKDFWNYKRDCGAFFRTSNTFLFLKYDGDLSIGDAVTTGSESDLKKAVRALRWVAALAGVARIKTYCSPSSSLTSVLGRQGHVKNSLAYGYVAFEDGLPLADLQFTYVDYDTF